MTRPWFVLALAALAACGDNSKECGEGTRDVGGVCTPSGMGTVCGDGTKLDPVTNACVTDPTVCGSGTVLVDGTCQDPTAGLTIDLEEGPEPNQPGYGPAGFITLKSPSDPHGFVIHGCVAPVGDTADLDDYILNITGPTLIDITADGVQGLAAGFVAVHDDPALPSWQRFGLDLSTDMSHREIYLPKAGQYDLVLSDTRSLIGLVDGSSDVLPPAGNPDGTSCYYVTIKQEAIPNPTTLAVPDGATGTLDNKIHFFSGALPNGIIDLTETIDSTHAAPALELVVGGQLRKVDSSGDLLFGGILPTDSAVIVADFVYNYAVTPPPVTLAFRAATVAQALPTDGSTLGSTVHGKSFTYPNFDATNELYFDAPAAGAIIGMDLAFSTTMQGVIADSAGFIYGSFGGLSGTHTFTTYQGLWRAPAAGRYYLTLFDPGADPVGTAFTVRSTLTPLAPPTAMVGTPLTAQADTAVHSNPFLVDITNNTWDSIAAHATNATSVAVTAYDPAKAYGRLDAITLSTGISAGTAPLIAGTGCPASVPGCSFVVPAAGGLAGYITRTLGPTQLLLKVNPIAPTGTVTFGLDVEPRVMTDLGSLTATGGSRPGDTSPANDAHRYFFIAPTGSHITITAHPTTGAGDPILEQLAPNETVAAGGNLAGAGADETLSYTQDLSGFTAFQVRGALGAAQTYDLTITVTLPFYTLHPGTTAFTDACSGTVIPLADTDEGVSAPQTTPAAFTFYGAPAPSQYVIAANGFISFDPAVSGSLSPAALPDGSGEVNLAPLWQDLDQVVLCKRTAGTKTIVQWTGEEFLYGTPVQFQAILDTADGSIEYVYGPGNQSDGTDFGATAGVQNQAGDAATQTGDGNVAAFAAAGSSVKLTHP